MACEGGGDAVGLGLRALEDLLLLEDAQHLERHRGAQRVPAEGVPVVEGAAGSAEEALEDARRRERRRHRQQPAGEALRGAEQVRRHAGVLRGPHRAAAPVAGEDLVEDQEDVVAVAQLAGGAQERRIVRAHAGGALQHGLDHHARRSRPPRSPSMRSRAPRPRAACSPARAGAPRSSHPSSAPSKGFRNASTPPIAVAPSVSPWKASSSATKRRRPGRPFCAQYWSESLSATSTAVEPSSL